MKNYIYNFLFSKKSLKIDLFKFPPFKFKNVASTVYLCLNATFHATPMFASLNIYFYAQYDHREVLSSDASMGNPSMLRLQLLIKKLGLAYPIFFVFLFHFCRIKSSSLLEYSGCKKFNRVHRIIIESCRIKCMQVLSLNVTFL